MCRLGVRILPKLDDSAIERPRSRSRSRDRKKTKSEVGPMDGGYHPLGGGYNMII